MNLRNAITRCLVAAAVTMVAGLCADGTAAQPGSDDAGAELEVLTRGPVHEAFAETVTFDPQPGVVVTKAPPAAIEELPPDNRPEGANVAWIPGYWAWDDDSTDFLWVSGTWRVLPPGRQWVPGYWSETRQGAQWTSGYWADADLTEVEYLPEPPETVESGPNIAAPSENDVWLPGCWVWQQNRYSWRPGFWSAAQQNWVWIPAHYQWAPRGYVFVDGYWDYAIDRRGVLFAPVSFNRNVYGRRGYTYTPFTVIDLGVFTNHLFLRPNYGHYYFGDYYGARYSNIGFSPWFSYHSSRSGYDPFYAHQRWHHRRDRGWEQQVQANFRNLDQNSEARPPRTWQAQQERVARSATSDRKMIVATPYEEILKRKNSRIRFQPVDQSERQRVFQQARNVQKFRAERQKLETPAVDRGTAAPEQKPGPARVKIPVSPVVGKPAQQLDKDHAPPQRHRVPEFDSKVKPRPRQDRSQPAVRDRPSVNKPQDKPQNRPKSESTPKKIEKPKDAPQRKPPSQSPEQSKKPKDVPHRKPADKPSERSKKPKDVPQRKPADKPPERSKKNPKE